MGTRPTRLMLPPSFSAFASKTQTASVQVGFVHFNLEMWRLQQLSISNTNADLAGKGIDIWGISNDIFALRGLRFFSGCINKVMSHYISAQMTRRPEDEHGVTIRPSSTSVFAIDSRDRYTDFVAATAGTSSPYDFQITKRESLFNGFFSRIALTEIVFPWYVPNITGETYQIGFHNAVVGTVTLSLFDDPAGGGIPSFQSPESIAAELQAQILALGATTANLRVIWTGSQFLVADPLGAPVTAFSFQRIAPVVSYQLFDMLNMNVDNTVDATSQFSGSTRCRWTEYVDIVSSQLTYNQDLKDSTSSPIVRDVLARIYLETEDEPKSTPVYTGAAVEYSPPEPLGTYPFVIYRQFKTPKQIKWNDSQPIGNLRFEVYDDKGRILTIRPPPAPGTGNTLTDYKLPNWRMTMLVSEE